MERFNIAEENGGFLGQLVRDVEIQKGVCGIAGQVSANHGSKNKKGHSIRKAMHFWCHVGSQIEAGKL